MPRKRVEPYLFLRGGVWQAVMEIPAALRKRLGKRRFAVSLDTDSLTDARRRRDRHVMDWKEQLARAKGEWGDTDYWRQQADKLSDDEGQRSPAYWRTRLRGAKSPEERQKITEEISDAAYLVGMVNVDEIGRSPDSSPEARRFYAEAVGAVVPFAENLDEWLTTSRATQKTKDMQRADVLRFAAKFPMVQDVTRPEVRRWITGLMNGDAASRDTKPLTPKTVQRILSALRGYWRYLQTMRVAAEDDEPFSKLEVARQAKRTEPRSSWRPFKPGEVVKLLNAAVKLGDDELADLIRLGMWSGARIEELCALKIEKVKRDHFAVEDAKTAAGWREVPIHPKVAPVFKRLIGKRKTGYVMENLTANKYGDRSNAIGKRFGRLKSAKGFGSQFVYHSIRKTVVTILENAGVPENVVADLVGHEKKTITFGLYSGGVSLAVKREALAKLAY